LQGFEDTALERFLAGQTITVEIKNMGPFLAGVRICVDSDSWRTTRHLLPGTSETHAFAKFGDTPMTWEVFLIAVAGDNSTLGYFIRG
jgi:hypothetical protein